MITLRDFTGVWQVDRLIEDAIGVANGTFVGTAVFAHVDDNRLNYREDGILRLENGHQIRAERGYTWQRRGPCVEVMFADGRPFHTFDPNEGSAAEHQCDPDVYRVTYDLAAWPDWSSVWRVTGPRKDYVMTTSYRR